MMRRKAFALGPFVAAAILSTATHAQTDALKARVISEDADRFAALFKASDGAPTADALRREYLDPATRGVEIFTPYRIVDAENLAAKIAAKPDEYRRGIDVCLPIAKQSSAELRAVYLAFEGLLGDVVLPEIYVVFGGGNSGGTTGAGAQVLGLEVICRLAESEEDIRALLRQFYAHETVHTLQGELTEEASRDFLLAWSMQEGVADFVAWLVTGRIPHPERAAWAAAREAEIWAEFAADRKKVSEMEGDPRAKDSPLRKWLANAGSPPEGWPSELGYWVGMRIAQAYFDQAEDKRVAVTELLELKDPQGVLNASGYAIRVETP